MKAENLEAIGPTTLRRSVLTWGNVSPQLGELTRTGRVLCRPDTLQRICARVRVRVLSHGQLIVTPRTVARQAPLSMEHWSGLPFPSPRDLLTQGLNPGLLHFRQILYH